jgi:fatty acid desaturase
VTAATDARPGVAWQEALSREEIRALLTQRDWRSWISIALDWGLVFASFAAVARWPHPLVVVLALFVIGGRQLGFAILMHDAAHRVLLRSRRWNDRIGNWLCAYPIWSDLHPYRAYHLVHHAKNWTPEDPDLALAAKHPVTRASMRRKVWRDLSGRTGRKFARAAFQRSFGSYRRSARARRATHGFLITNACLLAGLAALGHAELYPLWVGAWLTTHTLVARIRSIAEHGMVPDPADPLRNTRTTLASWWERLFLAPNRVNFHLEHHLIMTVPHYHLPRLHRLLRERGALEGACVARGYREVLRAAASKPASPAPAPVPVG